MAATPPISRQSRGGAHKALIALHTVLYVMPNGEGIGQGKSTRRPGHGQRSAGQPWQSLVRAGRPIQTIARVFGMLDVSGMETLPRIFISYARSDGRAFAEDFERKLKTKGVHAWRDIQN